MRKSNVAKRFGIASLCLATAVSAFSGMMLLDNNVAIADEAETIQLTDFVHTSASVAVTQVTCRDTTKKEYEIPQQDYTGLRISSDDAYTATFKTVFDGSSKFKFRFPETYTDAYYGHFNFRITDAVDDSKYFDITYYVENEALFAVAPYVQWGDEIRMSTHHVSNASWSNEKIEGKTNYRFAPSFLTKAKEEEGADIQRHDRLGMLELAWISGVLTVSVNTTANQDSNPKKVNMIPIAVFDGTYDPSATDNGFISKSQWGLPKLEFKNGYTVTVSSSIDDERTTDHGTDVFFLSIINDSAFSGNYDFSQTEMVKGAGIKEFEESFEFLGDKQATDGKFFLGWRNTETNRLYPAYSMVRKGNYEALEITYDTMVGASVRIDPKGGKSGIRFQTLYNVDEYAKLESFIQSQGTLITYTDTLTNTGKEFTIENYQSASTFAQVKNTKGAYEYTDQQSGTTYMAYSMAVVDIKDYTKAFSARGYLVVEYTNGTTQMIYTDYNATDNSRSIAEVATLLQQTEEYANMTDEEKRIVDSYIVTNVEPGEDPVEPGEDPVEPGEDPVEPGEDPVEPGEDPVEPGEDPVEPGEDPVEPGEDPVEPGEDPVEPGEDPVEPDGSEE